MFEAGDELGFAGQRDIENLEGHVAIEIAVTGGVDHAHASAAQLGLELVAGGAEVGQRRDLAQVVEDGIA